MRRVRLALLALALAVALPVGLLVARALQSAEAERRIRHDAVARRTFDEMERVLSAWLEQEEARPFEAYRFYHREDGTRLRSPLSRPPTEPFVVGAFQVDPDGTVHTPLRPRDEAAARERGDWPPDPETAKRVERVLRLARFLPERPRRERPRRMRAAVTLPDEKDETDARALLAPPHAGDRDFATAPAPAQAAARAEPGAGETERKRDATSAYEVLESLNRAASLRSERRQKVTRAPRTRIEAEEAARADAAPPSSEPMDPRERGQLRGLGYAQEPARERAAEEGAPGRESATVRIALDPMIGVPLDGAPDAMALYRTVVVGQQGYRQGLVIDLAALGRHLEAQVVRGGPLAGRARVRFGPPGLPDAPAPGTAYSFTHRFGDPFDPLAVRLDLEPLEGAGDDRPLYALLALIAVLTGAGLFAVDRLTGVAVEYAERRSNFVAAVSHELKTPLTAIRMHGEMLRDGLVPGEGKRAEYYATITDESERLSRLIDNVLEFSRLENGRRELEPRAGNVAVVVREAALRLAPHAERHGFALRVHAEEDLPPVLFDRDALLQVLFNLVDNAIKYAATAARREIVLEVTRAGDGVALAVRDFGPGVATASLRRIFEPFYRGENELTRSARGTGIGLALVRELVSAMGARVEGERAEGGGLRVRIALRPA